MSVQAAGFPTLDTSEPPLCLTGRSSKTVVLRRFGTASQKERQAAKWRVCDENCDCDRAADCELNAGSCRRQARRTERRLDLVTSRDRKPATDARGGEIARSLRLPEGRPGLPVQTSQLHPDHAYTVAADRGPATSGSRRSEL